MLRKLFLIFLLTGIHHVLTAGHCNIISYYHINGGPSSPSAYDETRVYNITINPLDTISMYVEYECSLQYQWLCNDVPIPGANSNDFKTDSAGTYAVYFSPSNYVIFVIEKASACAVLNAGADQELCSTVSSIDLNGSRTYYSNVVWTGGSGSYHPNANTVNPTYYPSYADTAAGIVKFYLNGQGSCSNVRDSLTITFKRPIKVDAGIDQTVCNTLDVPLNGFVTTNAAGGIWSSTGTGQFNPDEESLTATYHPSSSDLANGSVTLTLKGVGSGTCTESDHLLVTLNTCLSTGSLKLLTDANIQIFPNPNEGRITIDFTGIDGFSSVEILNVLGEKIKIIESEKMANRMSLDIEQLNSGTYFVVLLNNDGQRVIKKIVRK